MYNVYEIRKQFPMLNNKTMQGKPLVFLDNASTTFKPQCVIDEIVRYNSDITSNSHRGDYDLCYKVDQEIDLARQTIANFINCNNNEVVFTSGDTMSINIIAYGLKDFINKGDEILISEIEHASNTLPWFKIAKEKGAVIKYIPLNKNGKIVIENVEKSLTTKTKVVAFAHVSNTLGYIVDVENITKLIKEKTNAIVAIDGAQSVPHMKVDFKKWNIDFLSFSAHKMCGPTGIGCLIGKYELLEKMEPLLNGGGMNEKYLACGTITNLNPPSKFEAGTLNLEGIIGFKKAVEFINSIGIENIHKYEQELISYAYNKLKENKNVIIYDPNPEAGVITFNVKDVFAQDEATLLNSKGIAVRSGQHCAKMMVNLLKTTATVRMSIYLYTTKEEIDTFIDAINNGGDILDAYFAN